MQKKPTCFIAMAFNKADTEYLFEGSIRPVLIKNSIAPIIINRQENNQDLNLQIINQLDICDFAIVDLTYARPSVYFEAGYAQREVEVIYTVRRDHLDRNNPEDRRVHFDLSMKNIITWDSPDDDTFPTRLERRIKSTFLKKWLANNNLNIEQEEKRKEFESMSINESLQTLRFMAVKELKQRGFTEWTIDHPYSRNLNYSKEAIIAGKSNYLLSKRVDGDHIHVVAINAFASLLKKELMDFQNYYDNYFIIKRTEDKKIRKKISFHLFFIAIRDIPIARIQDVYPTFRKIDSSRFQKVLMIEKKNRSKNNKIEIDYNLYFISKIKSIPEYVETLSEVLMGSDI